MSSNLVFQTNEVTKTDSIGSAKKAAFCQPKCPVFTVEFGGFYGFAWLVCKKERSRFWSIKVAGRCI